MSKNVKNDDSIKREFTDYAVGAVASVAIVFAGVKNNMPIELNDYFPMIYFCLLGGYGSYKTISHGLAYLKDQKRKGNKFTIL